MKKILLPISILLFWTCSSPTKSEPAPLPPTVNNLSISTNEDTPTTFTMTGTDPEGAALTFSIVSQPQHGLVSTSGNAGTYTPNTNFNGSDTFSYSASDGSLVSSAGIVTVTVTPVDDNPNTMDVSAVIDEDTSVILTLKADEFDGDTIVFSVQDDPENGSVTISNNKATYSPNKNWYGSDSFTFEATDASSRRILNLATASIIVNPVNDAPVVEAQIVQSYNNENIQLNLTATDVEGDNVSFDIVDNPVNVSASIDGSTLTINKSSSFWGTDSLTYNAYDGTEFGNSAKVNITFKRYINYKRSAYELRNSDLWIDQQYFWNNFGHGAEWAGEADFDGDGDIDVILSFNDETEARKPSFLYLNNGDDTFTDASHLIQNNIGTLFTRKDIVGDFNGDNIPDTFYFDTGAHAGQQAHQAGIFSNTDGTFSMKIFEDYEQVYAHGGTSADIDNDGDIDIFVCSSQDEQINGYFMINDGSGNFTYDTSRLAHFQGTAWEATLYDLNKDNYPDLILDGTFWDDNTSLNLVLFNNSGSFDISNSVRFPQIENDFNPGSPTQIVDHGFYDLDGDGNIEIIASYTWSYDEGGIRIFKHDGDFNFYDNTDNMMDISHIDIPGEADLMFRIRVQDIDNDGNIELFNDKQNLAYDWGQMWEWNGSKFIKVL